MQVISTVGTSAKLITSRICSYCDTEVTIIKALIDLHLTFNMKVVNPNASCSSLTNAVIISEKERYVLEVEATNELRYCMKENKIGSKEELSIKK